MRGYKVLHKKASRKKRAGDCSQEEEAPFKGLPEKKESRRLRGQSEKKGTREELVSDEPREDIFKRENGQQMQIQQKACDRRTSEGMPQGVSKMFPL